MQKFKSYAVLRFCGYAVMQLCSCAVLQLCRSEDHDRSVEAIMRFYGFTVLRFYGFTVLRFYGFTVLPSCLYDFRLYDFRLYDFAPYSISCIFSSSLLYLLFSRILVYFRASLVS
jgi:hypothetical protein